MADNEYTINILNADELYVEGKRIQQLDLGTLVEKADGIGIGINNSFPRIIFDISGTDGLRVPAGTSGQRPLTTLYDNIPANEFEGPDSLTGVIRFNKDNHKFEGWTGENPIKGIGLNNSSWGSFVQEDNDNLRVKFSDNINNLEMLDFYIHTLKHHNTLIGNNLGNYSQTLNDWTNRSKGPASYIALWGGEYEESQINFHTSTMAKGQAAGLALGVTQRMRITSNGHIAIGDNFNDATSRLTIKGADKFPNYSTTAAAAFGNAFNGTDGYGQVRLVASQNSNAHLDIGTSTTIGSPGMTAQTASYMQSQNANTATSLLLQPTGGNVGIGTLDPDRALHIKGPGSTYLKVQNGNDTANYIQLGATGAANRIYSRTGNDSSFPLYIENGSTVTATFSSNNYVGIGRTNPYTKLHVKANGAVFSLEGSDHCYMQYYRTGGGRTAWIGNGGNGSNSFSITNQESGGSIYLNTNNSLIYSNSTMQINWRNSAGILNLGDAYNGIRADIGEGVTINTYQVANGIHLQQTTGRVGIGTRSPGYRLEVQGNGYFADGLRVYGTTDNASGFNSVFYVGKNDNDDWGIQIDHGALDYGLDINCAGNHAILFRQNGGNMARINSEGNIERYKTNSGYLMGTQAFYSSAIYTNPIYTIGRNYRPGDTTLNNMYGIGYTDMGPVGGASFLNGLYYNYIGRGGWGLYVAADGDARIFLNGSYGDIVNSGNIKAGGYIYAKTDLYTDRNLHVYGEGYFSNWIRSYGPGWYHQTYNGGWQISDYTWIRAYGNKSVYIGSTNYHGLLVNNRIRAAGFDSNSDERIKKNIEQVPDNLSLQKLREIECYYYDYKDESKNTGKKVIGFIAQQVNKHFPNAVSKQKSIIPNVYKPIKRFKLSVCDKNGNVLNPSVIGDVDETVDLPGKQLLYSDINGNFDEDGNFFKCKCNINDCEKYESDPEHYFKLTILDNYNFDVNKKYQFNCSTINEFDAIDKVEQVSPMKNDQRSFIIGSFAIGIIYYGEEVEDFLTVDKQRIFALNFSATQEIDKIQRAEIEKVKQLESIVLTQKNTIDNLQSELSSLKTLLREKNII